MSEPNYHTAKWFSGNKSAIEMKKKKKKKKKKKATRSKPIYLGIST